jgi:hypothetical protein
MYRNYTTRDRKLELTISAVKATDGRAEDLRVFLNQVDVTEAFTNDELGDFEQAWLSDFEAAADDYHFDRRNDGAFENE